MAKRHTLSVAACTLALAASCLAGALPAAASAQPSLASTFTLPAAPSGQDLPSAAEVEAAKQSKAATDAMIARIEQSLASSQTELDAIQAAALEAQDALLTATEERDVRVAEADKAREQIELATSYFEQSRIEIGNIASDLYRTGASSSTLGILLQDDESNDVFYKAATINALSQSQASKLNSAAEAESLVTAWQDYASAAEQAAREATASYDQAATQASSSVQRYESALAPQQQLRDELIGHLAFLQEREEAAVREQIAQAEEAAAAEELERQISQNAVPQIEINATPEVSQVQPLSVQAPQELEATESETERDEVRVVPQPAPTPKPAPTPEAAPTPESTPTPKATPKPKETPKPKVTPTPTPTVTPKPKETQKPKATPTPTPTPKTTPKPKATPKPKETPKPQETIKPQSNNSYAAAIAWAMKTAKDPSKRYVYGGNGPNSYDCSGFTRAAFAQSGISLQRSSTQQYLAAPQYVSLSQLRPGDLVFSSSNGGRSMYHVAIYIGNGQVVHARNPSAGISVTPLSWVNNLHPKAARY
ncbi:NlpC/P60 family protein [Glutamicibacter uratoxydans]|uniref:NlpC/P60 family protein n=1 Tax=Glutamicibacter uratoxydans TaxID=43667 RepID=UPI003D6EB14C